MSRGQELGGEVFFVYFFNNIFVVELDGYKLEFTVKGKLYCSISLTLRGDNFLPNCQMKIT